MVSYKNEGNWGEIKNIHRFFVLLDFGCWLLALRVVQNLRKNSEN